MATAPTQAPAPTEQVKPWRPPAQDEEFVFESVDAAPSWIDKGWAGFDRGPALQLPAGDLYGSGPYHTVTARVGDKVVYTAAKGAMPAKFTVIAGDPIVTGGTKRPPQVTNASLEDQLKQGYISPEDMNEDAKAQVAGRSPRMAGLVAEDEDTGPYPKPEPQAISEQLKLD